MATTPVSAAPVPALGLQDFLKVLLTQLTYQDPLKPMDNQQFMAQMAQFTALEQTQRLNDKIDQLVASQAALQSVGLIGRTVELETESGRVTGTVSALSLQTSPPTVTLTTTSGSTLADQPLSRIARVR